MMKERAKEIIKVTDEAINTVMKLAMGSSDNLLRDMSNCCSENIAAIKLCYEALEVSKRYILEQADQMDRIEQKLDLLLESKKGEETP